MIKSYKSTQWTSSLEQSASRLAKLLMFRSSSSQLFQVKVTIDMLHTMVPEEHDLAFGDLLGPDKHQFNYIIKMSTQLSI